MTTERVLTLCLGCDGVLCTASSSKLQVQCDVFRPGVPLGGVASGRSQADQPGCVERLAGAAGNAQQPDPASLRGSSLEVSCTGNGVPAAGTTALALTTSSIASHVTCIICQWVDYPRWLALHADYLSKEQVTRVARALSLVLWLVQREQRLQAQAWPAPMCCQCARSLSRRPPTSSAKRSRLCCGRAPTTLQGMATDAV